MNKETEQSWTDQAWRDLAKVIDKVYKKSLKDHKFSHDPDVGVFKYLYRDGTGGFTAEELPGVGTMKEAMDNGCDEGSGELATSESHICVFFDPGVGQELWCKHEGCKEVKDRF